MNQEVAERLINNLNNQIITHNQYCWVRNGGNIFVISEDDRWGCATAACAAGFVYLQEAAPDMVFDSQTELVFTDYETYRVYEDYWDTEPQFLSQKLTNDYEEFMKDRKPAEIADWAAEVLEIDEAQAEFIFFQFGDTRETINHINFIKNGYWDAEVRFDPFTDYSAPCS